MTYLDKYLDTIQGQDTSVRGATSKGCDIHGPHHPRDALSKGRNVLDFLSLDTSFRDTLSLHPDMLDDKHASDGQSLTYPYNNDPY